MHGWGGDLSSQAQAAHAKGELEKALALYQEALETQQVSGPEGLSDIINVGALLRQVGNAQAAADHYRRWLPQVTPNPTFSMNACNCLRELGEASTALRVIESCLRSFPRDCGLQVRRAECLLDLGRIDESRIAIERVLGQEKSFRAAWVCYGVILAKAEQLEMALEAFAEADALGTDQGQMAANRISILKDLRRLDEAEQLWQSLEGERQYSMPVRGSLAGLRLAQNRPEEASQLLAKLCQEQPQEANHWLNWAACLRSLKYTVAPTQILKRGMLYQPRRWELQESLAQALAEMGNLVATARAWQIQEKREEEKWKDINVFNRQFLGVGGNLYTADIRSLQAKKWEKRKTRTSMVNLWQDHLVEPLGGRPLRVGYLTADACNHPVGRFLLPILKHHNSLRVETWVLTSGSHHDWITEQLRDASKHWLDISSANDRTASRLIADLRLDIVVELGGFTGGSRIGVLVNRPAPVQLSYLGYPGPTYLNCIDGWIGDTILFGGLSEIDHNAHHIININGGYMAFDPGEGVGLPEREQNERFRFGCFNHARKLSDEGIRLFVDLLDAVPSAELVLKSITFHEKAERERIRSRFERAGLNAERLVLLEWVEGGMNHLMRYSAIDVAVDPVPYGGATTTCEALWMGVPVISLAGAGMCGRLSASILDSAGCQDWIATTKTEYIDIAKSLAEQGARHHEERLKLRNKVKSSDLANAGRLTRALEECYASERARVSVA